ncbi:hypothetical protein BDY21DRAFT_356446 [Lineolata rhizophorae]|uniref:Uncharacterized protein n=1 Tax=Lineolata rhizophorae TaxID=578093 RepID=A0A6A6NPW9_9PEZI|nr:hypothetical protein BDY21DRAFT_356446 [Lineolata rhizophorae]
MIHSKPYLELHPSHSHAGSLPRSGRGSELPSLTAGFWLPSPSSTTCSRTGNSLAASATGLVSELFPFPSPSRDRNLFLHTRYPIPAMTETPHTTPIPTPAFPPADNEEEPGSKGIAVTTTVVAEKEDSGDADVGARVVARVGARVSARVGKSDVENTSVEIVRASPMSGFCSQPSFRARTTLAGGEVSSLGLASMKDDLWSLTIRHDLCLAGAIQTVRALRIVIEEAVHAIRVLERSICFEKSVDNGRPDWLARSTARSVS